MIRSTCDNMPDNIYLAALKSAKSPEERHLRTVLVFHRSYLNGGLSSSFESLEAGETVSSVIQAYEMFGLADWVDIIREAAPVNDYLNTLDDTGWENRMDDPMAGFDEKYLAATYKNNEQADHMELPVLAYIQAHQEKFSNVLLTAKA